MKKTEKTSRGNALSLAEAYFAFLGTPLKMDNGDLEQIASTKFIDMLREAHAAHRSRYDLSACLAGTASNFNGRVWFWSDIHFFHNSIIRYCQRPFADVAHMNDALLKNCLACVRANDILVFGGDVTFGTAEATNHLLRAIPAYKILVLGNHDIDGRTKTSLFKLAMDEVAACMELEYKGTPLFLSHYPVHDKLLAPGQINLHGHLHNTPFPKELGTGARRINISIECTGYEPVSINWLLENAAK